MPETTAAAAVSSGLSSTNRAGISAGARAIGAARQADHGHNGTNTHGKISSVVSAGVLAVLRARAGGELEGFRGRVALPPLRPPPPRAGTWPPSSSLLRGGSTVAPMVSGWGPHIGVAWVDCINAAGVPFPHPLAVDTARVQRAAAVLGCWCGAGSGGFIKAE